MLMGSPVIQLSHVKRNGNMVADDLANQGVGRNNSFHEEKNNENKNCMIWRQCEELTEIDAGKMACDNP